MWSRVKRAGRVVLAVLSLGVAMQVGATEARAQGFGGPDMMGMMSISKRSLDSYAKKLGFTPEQTEALQALHEGYRSEAKKAADEFGKAQREAMREAQEEQDWGAMGKIMAKEGAKLQERMQASEKQFLEDFRSLCTEAQAGRWPAVERARRRDQFMRVGMVSGAGVDVLAAADRTKTAMTGNEAYDAVAEQYELEIDRKLTEFKRVQEEMQAEQMKQAEEGFDFSKMQEMMAKAQEMLKPIVEVSTSLRDTNREYARKLADLMTEADRNKFNAEVDLRTHPRVYRASHTTKSLDAALKLADLTPEQAEQIRGIRDSYAADAQGLNTRWASAIEEQEAKNGGTFGVMTMGFMGGGDEGQDPVRDARKARRDLDKQVLERLKGVLTEAQREQLPARDEEPFNPMADFMVIEPDGE